MINGKSAAPILDRPRARRDAAKRLAIALQTRYRKLLEASGEDEIVIATSDLAQCMYENIEFVIWGLKSLGGLYPPPPEELRRISPTASPANDPRPAPPEPLCTCPPLEAGIIGRERHMTSCPHFTP